MARGHGAYLMNEEKSGEALSVSVGNLPPHCEVIIKLVYVTEQQLDDGKIVFRLPAALAPARVDSALQDATQGTTGSAVANLKPSNFSFASIIFFPPTLTATPAPAMPTPAPAPALQPMARLSTDCVWIVVSGSSSTWTQMSC